MSLLDLGGRRCPLLQVTAYSSQLSFLSFSELCFPWLCTFVSPIAQATPVTYPVSHCQPYATCLLTYLAYFVYLYEVNYIIQDHV